MEVLDFHGLLCAVRLCLFSLSLGYCALREQAYSNILKILPLKSESFQMKNSKNFHISAQNIDYGYSFEPPR